MVHLGIVVYYWGQAEQSRLIAECIGPLAATLRKEGLATRFWFDRYDARGPHVFAILSVPVEAREESTRRLSVRLDEYLAVNPSREDLTGEQLEKLHRETRSRLQCEVDGYPGLASNNSYCLFEHLPRGYPFRLSNALPGEEELWSLLEGVAFWTINQFATPWKPAIGAGVRWVAAVDRELRAAGADPTEYWRYHATTLLLPLRDRLATAEKEVLASLGDAIGAQNSTSFLRIWGEADNAGSLPRVDRIIRLASSECGLPKGRRWVLLREIDHFTLKQLGIPVAIHIPLVLFAWHQNLSSQG